MRPSGVGQRRPHHGLRASGWGLGLLLLLLGAAGTGGAYDPQGARDPFVPLVSEAGVRRPAPAAPTEASPTTGPGTLEGIVYDPQGGSVAVIGGAVLQEGDRRGDLELVRIGPSSVVVAIHGTEQEWRVPSPAVEEEGS